MIKPGIQLSGRYRLDERIAGGGMGDVWKGTDEVLGRTVAVKILLPALVEQPGFAERFKGEARTMASINHPGVVDIYDYGSDESIAYLVMEYVEGDALSRTLSRVGRLTPARTMALVAQAADALQAAHEKGIVHRDVKPGNLLVRPNGTLVLTDFGIARSDLVGSLTMAGSVLGTASYISPEQASGAVATPASDVYALGVVAYQCLAGRRPFEGDNPLELAMKHVRDAPPALPVDIPPAVKAIVERAMAKEPSTRWASAAQLAAVSRQASATLGHQPASAGQTLRTGSSVPVAAHPNTPTGQRVNGSTVPPVARPTPAPVVTSSGAAPGVVAGGRATPPYVAPGSPTPAGYIRGAASVQPAPKRPVAPPPYSYVQPPARQSSGPRTGWVVFWAIVAALIIVLCSGVISYLVKQGFNSTRDTGLASQDANSGPGGGAGAGRQVSNLQDIPCDQYRGGKLQNVLKQLKADGFTPKVQLVAGNKSGQVVDVAPCRAASGATITVQATVVRADTSGPDCGNLNGSIDACKSEYNN